MLLDFQPYADLPEVMASADVLVAILEPDASRFSVPSKVLTYLCSSRAIVGVLPPDNSVAEILSTHGAGRVVDPADRDEVAAVVAELLDEEELCQAMGRAGRRYAERTFSPETAADRFIEVFGDLVADRGAGEVSPGERVVASPAPTVVQPGRRTAGRPVEQDSKVVVNRSFLVPQAVGPRSSKGETIR